MLFNRLTGIISGILLTVMSSFAASYYVAPAPTGNDNAAGTIDAPFATISKARDVVRGITSGMTTDHTVFIRAGRFEQSATLAFGASDAGTNNHFVNYQAYNGEAVHISGGTKITGWTSMTNGWYKVTGVTANFRQMWVNDKRAVRARHPNLTSDKHLGDYFRLSDWQGDGIQVPAGQAQTNWLNVNQIEAVINRQWENWRYKIASVANNSYANCPGGMKVTFSSTTGITKAWPNSESGQWYYFENALEFLDQPGEWYLNTTSQTLYYYPQTGENMATAEVIVPKLETLISVSGTNHIKFSGITFEHTTYVFSDPYHPVQAALGVPPGFQIASSNNIVVEGNVIQHFGGSGIGESNSSHDNAIRANYIWDISGNGIYLNTAAAGSAMEGDPKTANTTYKDTITNNFVCATGREFRGACGILATYIHTSLIEHNEVTNNPYTGISLGWGWNSGVTAQHDNMVRYNNIHDVMQLLDDGGAIYTLSKNTGTRIEENLLYNVNKLAFSSDWPIRGIYLDQGTQYITVNNNICSEQMNISEQIYENSATNNTKTNNDAYTPSVAENAGPVQAYADKMIMLPPPKILPAYRWIVTSPVSATITTPVSGAQIRYTTDGTEPSANSPLYSSAISVSSSTTIKAKIFKNSQSSISKVHEYVALRNPENPTGTSAGLKYELYRLPNMNNTAVVWGTCFDCNWFPPDTNYWNSHTPAKSITASTLTVQSGDVSAAIGIRYTGYITVPTDGVYTFSSQLEESIQLSIGNKMVMVAEGRNSGGWPGCNGSQIGLKAGKHAIKVIFLAGSYGTNAMLHVFWKGPGITVTEIPASAFLNGGVTSVNNPGAVIYKKKVLSAIDIFDCKGTLVASNVPVLHNSSVQMKNLSKGTYLVRTSNQGAAKVQKVAIVR